MSTRLQLIHDDGAPELCVVVHGLDFGRRGYDYDTLERQVHVAELRGRVYVFQWLASVLSLQALLTGDLRKTQAADEAGASLAKGIARMQDLHSRPITLIGHSQGTYVIHSALEWLAERSRRVTRVLLMGGVVCADSELWEGVAPAVRQEIVNVHSSYDIALLPLRGSIGRNAIESRFRKIRDCEVAFGHSDYWENLADILKWTWPERRRSRRYHPIVETECECCETEIITTANVSQECPVCCVEAEYRLLDERFYYDTVPKKKTCRFCREGTIWVQKSALYRCDAPGCHAWSDMKRRGNTVSLHNSP